jgi:predicted site-specific integrase-resolvase
MSDGMLTPADVARMAGRMPATVRVWADTGKLPCVRLQNGTRVFKEADVERFLAERERRTAAAARD